MKAIAVYPGQPNSVHLEDIPRPKVTDVPDGRGVLVRVLKVGVDATDREINEALYGNAPPGDKHLVLGHESFGVIEEVGPNVRRVKPGDYVNLEVDIVGKYIEKLLAYRERMGWSFTWASSHDSDFNFDFGVSAGEWMMHASALPRLEANELALLKLLRDQPAVRESLPLVTTQNARATGTDLEGYFSEGHGFSTFARAGGTVYHCYSSYARGTEFLLGYYAILDRAPKGRDEGDQPMSWLRRHDEYDER